jgi:hypothetical protein
VTQERLEWIMSGLSPSKLNKYEKLFIDQVKKNFDLHGNLTMAAENRLEGIFRAKSR